MATLAFEHVEKVFAGGTVAVADLCLEVADRELLVLVGPSGCGKSTVLRLVAGLEEPTAGTLRIGGRVANALPPQERNVAMVFQDYALYPHMTARANLAFPLRMRRLARDEMARRIERVAGLLDIAPLLDRLPRQLSGGQRQRVAMGRALVREPSVFLLDEPLSNLDAKLRVQVRAEMRDLQRRTGTTMLYVTHDQVEAMTMGDRVVVLDGGRLQQAAPPRTLYEQPANTFVAGFIGAPPMNLFTSRVSAAGGQLALHLGSRRVPIAPAGIAADRLRGHLEGPLTAGVRPEGLRLVSADEAVPGTVELLECLGHETLAHVRVDGGETPVRLVVRVEGMPGLAPEAPVRVQVEPGAVHLFDAAGRSLAG